MNNISSVRSIFLGIFISLIAVMSFGVAPVYADNVSSGLNDLKTKAGNAFPKTAVDGNTTVAGLFAKIINIALGIGFVIAVIMVIYGGYLYILSGGNEEQAAQGRKTLLYALLGMIIIILSFVIVAAVTRFVMTGNAGNTPPTNTTPGNQTPTPPSGNQNPINPGDPHPPLDPGDPSLNGNSSPF